MSLKGARKSRIDSLQKCWQLMFDEQKLDDVQMRTLHAISYPKYAIYMQLTYVNACCMCECALYM